MHAKITESSEILTVMFTDIVEYSKTTAQLSRNEFEELHNMFDSISLPIFDKYAGKVVKKIGDAFLVTFKSPTNAVLCGIELQNAFDRFNKHAKRPIKIRVALHTGEVIIRNEDIYGDAVNATARIESITPAGQIVFSEAVFSAMNKKEVPYIHLGLKKLKGIKYPIRLFKVKSMYDEILRRRRAVASFFNTLIWIAIIAVLIFFALRYMFLYTDWLPI